MSIEEVDYDNLDWEEPLQIYQRLPYVDEKIQTAAEEPFRVQKDSCYIGAALQLAGIFCIYQNWDWISEKLPQITVTFEKPSTCND
jgi:hypothetical protein